MVIVASLALIFIAIGLAALGVVRGSDVPLVGSIAASLLAVLTLLIGQRRAAGARLVEAGSGTDREVATPAGAERAKPAAADRTDRVVSASAPTMTIPVQADAAHETAREHSGRPDRPAATPASDTNTDDYGDDDYGDFDDEDPPDEPPPQLVPPGDAERVARMTAVVLVVDGRPRYHLASCDHLDGRDSEEISVREAVELGFTPCSRCEPDTALLAEAYPV